MLIHLQAPMTFMTILDHGEIKIYPTTDWQKLHRAIATVITKPCIGYPTLYTTNVFDTTLVLAA